GRVSCTRAFILPRPPQDAGAALPRRTRAPKPGPTQPTNQKLGYASSPPPLGGEGGRVAKRVGARLTARAGLADGPPPGLPRKRGRRGKKRSPPAKAGRQ